MSKYERGCIDGVGEDEIVSGRATGPVDRRPRLPTGVLADVGPLSPEIPRRRVAEWQLDA